MKKTMQQPASVHEGSFLPINAAPRRLVRPNQATVAKKVLSQKATRKIVTAAEGNFLSNRLMPNKNVPTSKVSVVIRVR